MISSPVLMHLLRRLRQLLRGRGQSREDADDVIQDAFLRLQLYYRKGGEVRELEPFLVRTVLRLSSNARRDARRRAVAEQDVHEFSLVCTEPAPESSIAAEQSLRHIADKLRELSPVTRDVFLLHRVDGMSYAQIAKLFGISTKAVERRIARAMLAVLDASSGAPGSQGNMR